MVRKRIDNIVLLSWKVRKSDGKLSKEGKMALLAAGQRRARFGDCCDAWLVVSEEGERTTFKEESEMVHNKVRGQEFKVKSG